MQISPNYLKHQSKNPLQRFLIKNFNKSLISLIEPLSPKTILDVGCGEGFILNELTLKHVGQKIEGVDNSKTALSLGKKLFPRLSLKYADIYHLPYQNNSFDLVVCLEVLEHLKNPEKALDEILRVSKGSVIISVPNEPFFRISNLLRGKNLARWGNDTQHINHWNPSSFKEFLKKQGVSSRQIKFPFPWIMILLKK